MKLLIFSTEFPPGPGGIGTHAWQMARNLALLGWQVKVLTLQDYASEAEIREFNRTQPFPVETLHRQRGKVQDAWQRWNRLRKEMEIWQPEVLIATGEQAVLIAAVSRLQAVKAAIWHGVIPPSIFRRSFYRWAYQQMDHVVAVSRYSASKLIGMGIQPHHQSVITNGADAGHFKILPGEIVERFREELGLRTQPLLLTVGNVSERKGQDIVIRALPEILSRKPEVHYLIVGLPTRQAELTGLAQQLGVAGHVHFLGQVSWDLLPVIYNASDLFVLTSRHSSDGEFEGYGIVAVEAALCGKPSVVSNNSGLMEAVRDGETGLVVPEDDPHAAAEAVLRLLLDPEKLQSMGGAARTRALSEQTWEICMQRYDHLLRELVKD
ncbi:MAG: glycosyltransferase family 4 protein [Anaerolineales bacterium]|jgi:phosphatidylinositol alpha-1,6-mannosyltransferase|nr:glycosyltransferase family 4 protein [Anaerolineales bacterium]